ncbi:kinase-like domain-containing protein [Thamnocephalis sphaerospora]|uniref:Kinase-like domain-containing protein n=1 Tax=Thamnocephalis sphaerospora TaxID=78915 RepID=A0A4P9XID6_9FUNG|nr:kinase-like domain-containing protein [Thamnocephalis sphaerospora]|eukprot:RKP05453.1 kinase-like domain-containing protein [Thamnocephalis sphaerospora]
MRFFSVASIAAVGAMLMCLSGLSSANPVSSSSRLVARAPGGSDAPVIDKEYPYGETKFFTAFATYRGNSGFIKCPTEAKLLRAEHDALEAIHRSPARKHGMSESVKSLFVKLHGIVNYNGLNCVMTERLEGSDLYDYARGLSQAQKNEQLPVIFMQVITALKYMHRIGWAHGDIKPENIFITLDSPNGPPKVKLIDFDMSVPVCYWQSGLLGGTYGYRAPEEFLGGTIDHIARDSWALGATMYASMMGMPPYGFTQNPRTGVYEPWGNGVMESKMLMVYAEKKAGLRPMGDLQNAALVELVNTLMTVDPKVRPKINDLDNILLEKLANHKSIYEKVMELWKTLATTYSNLPRCMPETAFS